MRPKEESIMRKLFLPFHVPSIGDKEVAEVVDTLKTAWVTTGPKVKQFEVPCGSGLKRFLSEKVSLCSKSNQRLQCQ